jgi:Arc/MetJ-type ribon-helix-helix transcriptional regulator
MGIVKERAMPYQLPADVLDQVRQQIATGHYASEDDVLRAALDALKFQDEELAAIKAGIDDMEAGRLHLFEDVDTGIRQRFGFSEEQ